VLAFLVNVTANKARDDRDIVDGYIRGNRRDVYQTCARAACVGHDC
jgi:hypothetical protein